MNEFDFQSGDFLDTLYVPSDAPITTDSATITGSTGLSSYDTTYAPVGGSFFDTVTSPVGATSAASIPQHANPVTTTTSSDVKPVQSFPPNFYTDINYEPAHDQTNGGTTSAQDESKQNEAANQQTAASISEEQHESQEQLPAEVEPQPEIEIAINNVVCSFSVRCHLNLRKVATEGINVIYKRAHGMVSMKLRNPRTTASLWSSGKITCTGATSEDAAKKSARRIARILQGMGYRVRLANFRVVNVLGTCTFPFGIRITTFSAAHKEASYEPELHPGVTYKIKDPKATLKIFSTGSITVTAPRVQNVQLAIEHIYPLVSEYQMEKRAPHGSSAAAQRAAQQQHSVYMSAQATAQRAAQSLDSGMLEAVGGRMHLMPTNRSRPGPGRGRKQGRRPQPDDSDFESDMDSSDIEDTSEEEF